MKMNTIWARRRVSKILLALTLMLAFCVASIGAVFLGVNTAPSRNMTVSANAPVTPNFLINTNGSINYNVWTPLINSVNAGHRNHVFRMFPTVGPATVGAVTSNCLRQFSTLNFRVVHHTTDAIYVLATSPFRNSAQQASGTAYANSNARAQINQTLGLLRGHIPTIDNVLLPHGNSQNGAVATDRFFIPSLFEVAGNNVAWGGINIAYNRLHPVSGTSFASTGLLRRTAAANIGQVGRWNNANPSTEGTSTTAARGLVPGFRISRHHYDFHHYNAGVNMAMTTSQGATVSALRPGDEEPTAPHHSLGICATNTDGNLVLNFDASVGNEVTHIIVRGGGIERTIYPADHASDGFTAERPATIMMGNPMFAILQTYYVDPNTRQEVTMRLSNVTMGLRFEVHTTNTWQITRELNWPVGEPTNPPVVWVANSFESVIGSPLLAQTPPGHRFRGWYTQPNGGARVTETTAFARHQNRATVAPITRLYARWYENSVTVQRRYNTAEWSQFGIPAEAPGATNIRTSSVQYGSSITAQPSILVAMNMLGFAFHGWWDTPAPSGGVQLSEVMFIPANDPITEIFARWVLAELSIRVMIDFNFDGAPQPTEMFGLLNQPYGSIIPEQVSHREDYEFVGWFTAREGGSAVLPSTILSRAQDHTIYARWVRRGQVDRTTLGVLIEENQFPFNFPNRFTRASFQAFDTAMRHAVQIYMMSSDDLSLTQNLVNSALTDLFDAINGLQFVGRNTVWLEQLIVAARGIQEDDVYWHLIDHASSHEMLLEVLAEIEDEISNPDYLSQARLEALEGKVNRILVSAQNALRSDEIIIYIPTEPQPDPIDTDSLQSKVDHVNSLLQSIAGRTVESVGNLNQAYLFARWILNTASISQNDVDYAFSRLMNAYDDLEACYGCCDVPTDTDNGNGTGDGNGTGSNNDNGNGNDNGYSNGPSDDTNSDNNDGGNGTGTGDNGNGSDDDNETDDENGESNPGNGDDGNDNGATGGNNNEQTRPENCDQNNPACEYCLNDRLDDLDRDLNNILNDIDEERDYILGDRDRDCETLTDEERDRLDDLDEMERDTNDRLDEVEDMRNEPCPDRIGEIENERDENQNNLYTSSFRPPPATSGGGAGSGGSGGGVGEFLANNWLWFAIAAGALTLILIISIVASKASAKKKRANGGTDLKAQAKNALQLAFAELNAAGSAVMACDTTPNCQTTQTNAMKQLGKTDSAMKNAENLVKEFLKQKNSN